MPRQKSGRMYSGHEAGNPERVGDAGLLGLRADVVAVVERDGAARLQVEHRAHVRGHRRHRAPHVLGRDCRAAAPSASASDIPFGT